MQYIQYQWYCSKSSSLTAQFFITKLLYNLISYFFNKAHNSALYEADCRDDDYADALRGIICTKQAASLTQYCAGGKKRLRTPVRPSW